MAFSSVASNSCAFTASSENSTGTSVAIDREALAHLDALDVVLQALAVHLALDLGGALERAFHGPETLDQVTGSFLADTWSAGNVIHRIAH